MRRLLQLSILWLLTLLCQTARADSDDYLQHRDIAYGSHERQVLDVYAQPKTSGAPIIVMVHGGGWRHGDKGMGRVVDNKVARWVPKGFLFVSINYRLMPDADPRQQADDAAAAVKFIRDNAKSWGGDPQKIVLMGHSAGAHLIALLTAAPAQFGFGSNDWLGAVSLDSGALDLEAIMNRKHMRLYDNAFGKDQALWQRASPLRQLEAKGPPVLLVCSSERRDKPCVENSRFADAARKLGRRAEVLPQALSHGEVNHELGDDEGYTRAVENFLGSLDSEIAQRLGGNSTVD